jgi:hypothetical protein
MFAPLAKKGASQSKIHTTRERGRKEMDCCIFAILSHSHPCFSEIIDEIFSFSQIGVAADSLTNSESYIDCVIFTSPGMKGATLKTGRGILEREKHEAERKVLDAKERPNTAAGQQMCLVDKMIQNIDRIHKRV